MGKECLAQSGFSGDNKEDSLVSAQRDVFGVKVRGFMGMLAGVNDNGENGVDLGDIEQWSEEKSGIRKTGFAGALALGSSVDNAEWESFLTEGTLLEPSSEAQTILPPSSGIDYDNYLNGDGIIRQDESPVPPAIIEQLADITDSENSEDGLRRAYINGVVDTRKWWEKTRDYVLLRLGRY